MKVLSNYYSIGKMVESGARIPLSSLFSLYGSLEYHDFSYACLKVYGRPHLVVLDSNFTDHPFQLVFNPSTTSHVMGRPNMLLDYNESLQL